MPAIKTSIIFDDEARSKLLAGVKTMAKAVETTLGPRGRNVAIAKTDPQGNVYERIVLHDGVSVSKAIQLEDEFENMGAQLVKEAAQKQVMDVGDGTTVAVLLARAFLEEINALVAAGINPMELRSSFEGYIQELIEAIKKMAIPVTSIDQKNHIATISAENKELGEMVAKVVDEVGENGVVDVQESKSSLTYVEKEEGMQLEKGLQHLWFITDPNRAEALLENPYILITDKDITTLEPLGKLLNEIAKLGEKLVIICNPMPEEPKAALIDNKMRGVLPNMAIFAPSFGINQDEILNDIAVFTGGKYITKDAGHKFEDVTLADLGRAEYVKANKTTSIIVGGRGDKQKIADRVTLIKTQLETEEQDFDQEKLKERLAKLTSGVSVIKAGGATEVEMKERLERIKDAVAATQAAVKSGIVPGGEVIFLQVRDKMSPGNTETGKMVRSLIYKALYEPFKKLLGNAGLNDGQMYEKIVITEKGWGVDVTDNSVKDMIKNGIVDPAAVSINALINASSVAVQLFTVGAVIIPNDPVSKLPKE